MRGPSTQPLLIASRSATSPFQPGVPEVAHRGDAGLEILPAHRHAEQRAPRRAHRRDGEHHVRIVVAEPAFIVL